MYIVSSLKTISATVQSTHLENELTGKTAEMPVPDLVDAKLYTDSMCMVLNFD